MKKFYLIASLLLSNCGLSVFAQLPGISAEPTTNSTNAVYTAFGETTLSLSWTAGDGASRLVVARAAASVDSVPKDGRRYTASSAYGSGTSLGSNQFVVFSGAGSSCQVTGLSPETEYYFSIFEFNGTGVSSNYLTSSKLNTNRSTLASKPTLNASELSFSNIDVNGFDVSFLNGNGTGRLVLARENNAINLDPVEGKNYIANSAFKSGSDLGGGTYVVYSGSEKNFRLSNLNPGKTYYLAVYEYNGSTSESYNYLKTGVNKASQISMFAEPTTGSSSLSFSNPSESSLTLNFTKGNGTNRVIVAHATTPVNKLPVDGESYSSNGNLLEGTDLGGGNYVVYNGAANTTTVNGLNPNSTYYFSVTEYNGTGNATNYYTNGIVSGSKNTLFAEPTVIGGNFNFPAIYADRYTVQLSAGNGSNRIVVAKRGNAVDQFPQDGKFYFNADSTFGEGEEVVAGSGCFVVYNGSENSFVLNGLIPNTVYHLAIFEYNGNGQNVNYKTNTFVKGQQATLDDEPTAPASNINFNNITGTSMTVNWENGSGAMRMVVARAGSISQVPQDGHDYTANSTFGKGSDINSGTFVVYNGTASTVDVKGLSPNTKYFFAVFEYNGSNSANNYLSQGFPQQSKSTLISKPTVAAANLILSPIQDSTASLSWTKGNGNNRMVIIHEGNNLIKLPDDGNAYTASPVFGKGSDIGMKTYVCYIGTGSSVELQGMSPGKAYYVSVIEFNGSDNEASYLTSPFPLINNLPAEPQVIASNFDFQKINAESINISWTSGDGAYRVLFAREGASVNKVPGDGKEYAANDTFGRGLDIGFANYVIYNGTGNTTVLKGMKNNTLYNFALFEYNKDLDGPANYASKSLTGSKSNVLLAVGNHQTIAFSVYPNPAKERFYVQSASKGSYLLFDLNGKQIASGILSEGQNEIEAPAQAGQYIVKIIQKEEVFSFPMNILY